MKTLDIHTVKEQYKAFLDSVKSVMLSTISEEGKPFVSYAPFVMHEGKLYIYLSLIANHFRNLELNPAVDVMLIEDESNTANLFARNRARFAGIAVNLGNEGYEDVFAKFGARFGSNTIGMLRTLDFSLFQVTLSEGRYVAGFGQAYDIDLPGDRFDHIARDGHQLGGR